MSFDIDRGFGFGEDAPETSGTSGPDSVWQAFTQALGMAEGQQASVAQIVEQLNKSALSPDLLQDQLRALSNSAASQNPGDNVRRLSELVRGVEPVRLSKAIAAGHSLTERKRLLQTMVGVLSVPAVAALLRAASHAYRQPMSPVLIALLTKSARLAQSAPADSLPGSAFRDLVHSNLDAWTADMVDTSSTGYDSFFVSDAPEESAADATITPEPERMIALSFESGEVGSTVWNAIAKLGRSDRGIRQVLDMLKTAPETSKSADMVAQQFATPDRLGQLLREKPVDLGAVDVLLARMLEAAGPVLLDAIIDAPTPRLRRQLLQRMSALGPAIWGLALERLKTETRPTALRDILASLRRTYCDVKNIPIEKFIRHEDVRVRKEALLLLLDDFVERDRAVVAALRDPDLEILKIGLKIARDGLPEAAVPILVKRVVDPKFPMEFRTSVLQLLARSQSLLALEVLLGYAGGKTLLGKPTLAAKSPAMLIALSGLARMWPNERRAGDILTLARQSTDEEIVAAVNASQVSFLLPEQDDDAEDA